MYENTLHIIKNNITKWVHCKTNESLTKNNMN